MQLYTSNLFLKMVFVKSKHFKVLLFLLKFNMLLLERGDVISCMDSTLVLQYNDSVSFKSQELEKKMSKVFTYLNSLVTPGCSLMTMMPYSYRTSGVNLTTKFKMTPHGSALLQSLGAAYKACVKQLSVDSMSLIIIKLAPQDTLNNIYPSKSMFSAMSCCNGTKHYCCPKGNLLRTPGSTLVGNACGKSFRENILPFTFYLSWTAVLLF